MTNHTHTHMQKHIQHNNHERTQLFRKIYLWLYWKGSKGLRWVLLCERWVRDRIELQHIDPPLLWPWKRFFSVLLGCSTGGLGTQPLLGHGSHSSIFFPTDLNFLSPGLYNNLTLTYFLRASQFALSSTPRQSRSPLISWYLRPDASVIYTGAILLLTAWPGRRSICNRSKTDKTCWKSKDQLMSRVLLWTPAHGNLSALCWQWMQSKGATMNDNW